MNQEMYPFNVYWTIPEMEIPYDILCKILEDNGFDRNEIPEPTERQQTARCVKSFHHMRGGSKTIADTAGETGTEASYALLGRGFDGEAVEYRESTRIVFDKESNTVRAEGAMGTEFLDRLNSRFRGNAGAADIRAWLAGVIEKCSGVPKRPSGGIYLVPGRFRTVFEQIQRMFRAFHNGAELYIERVYMGDEEKENIRMSVGDYMTRRLSEIRESAVNIRQTRKAASLRDKTQALATLYDLFTEALGISAAAVEINGQVASLVDELQDTVTAFNAVTPVENRSKTPLEVAEKVYELLQTFEGGRADKDTVAMCLKAEEFISRTSTVYSRVCKAVSDGYDKITVSEEGYAIA